MKKLAIFMSHPIQYQVPLLVKLDAKVDINTHTFFFWDFGVNETFEGDFGRKIKWDIPILDGYAHSFLKNYSFRPSTKFLGVMNFGVVSEIILHRYDGILIFGWGLFSNWLAVFSALLSGTRIILHCETPITHESGRIGFKAKVRNVILQKLFKYVSAFLYIGKENKKFYEHFGVPQEKLFYAPYAVDNSRYFKEAEALLCQKANLKTMLGIQESGSVILFVGKLIEKKRPMDLLKAYELLLQSWKGEVTPNLLFVGDGVMRIQLEDYAESHGLTQVYFPGFKNQLELSTYYTIADVFVLPSGAGETWGLVVNEAMCFRNPIIVSDLVGCGQDLVMPGENGFVFPLGNTQKLSECLLGVLSNEELRKKLGSRSREIIEKFSYENTIEGISAAIFSKGPGV